MDAAFRRVSGLIQRYRVDRRLPPVVLDLFRTSARLRQRELVESRLAALSVPLGQAAAPDAAPRRLGRHRIHTAGPTSVGAHEAAVATAATVCRRLSAARLHPFLTGRSGGHLSFGLRIEERSAALSALASEAGPGWMLRWEDRSTSGIVALVDADNNRRVKAARTWTIFCATDWGDRATGPERGVDVGFYARGASGAYERIGVRGHDRFDPRCATTVEVVEGSEFPGLSAFPVSEGLEYFDQPIHAVYTWVDGADGAWAEQFRQTAAQQGRTVDEVALNSARFRSRDELRYSLRSVWSYAGWIDHIWVVTAGQRPDWIVEDERLTIVDHRDILPASALPTFNSHAIESALHHIDGLAEHFVYFNDDMLLARPLPPEAFFTSNGLARIFPSGARVPGVEDERTLAVDTGARRGREMLRRRFGRVVADKPLHSPYPNRRSALEDLENDFADEVESTRASRFRSPSDVSIAASFAQHYAYATGRAVFARLENQYVNVESGRLGIALDRIRLGDDVDTYCINETFDVNGPVAEREQMVADFFNDVLPVASPWELA